MIFVVDNNVFSRTLRNMPLKSFNDVIYAPLSDLISKDIVISVDEVFEEMKTFFSNKSEEFQWLKTNKKCFQYLSDKECGILMEIFKHKKFREGIKEKSLRNGSPEADAMIVAKAKNINGIVVTAESNSKPNAEKIPNICVEFGVKYITLTDFYTVIRNAGNGKELLDDVIIWDSLDI
jgi:hypothetical protein